MARKKRSGFGSELPFDIFAEDSKGNSALDGFEIRGEQDDVLQQDFFHHLLEWQLALNIGNPQEMLDYIGLGPEQITTKQWVAVLAGQAVLPAHLLAHIAGVYEDYINFAQKNAVRQTTNLPNANLFRWLGKNAFKSAEGGFQNENGIVPEILTDIAPQTEPLVEVAVSGKSSGADEPVLSEDEIISRRNAYRATLKEKLAAIIPGQDFKEAMEGISEQLGINPLMVLGYIPAKSRADITHVNDCFHDLFFSSYTDVSSNGEEERFTDMVRQALGHPDYHIEQGIKDDIGINFGNLLDAYIARKQMSVSQLREALENTANINISDQSVHNWRSGHCTPSDPKVIVALGDILQLSPSETTALGNAREAAYKKQFVDFPRGRLLAQSQAGPKCDLFEDGTITKLSDQIDHLIANRDRNRKTIFGVQEQKLRESQQETLEFLNDHLKQHHLTGHAVLPGGCGKTRIAAFIGTAAKQAGLRTLVMVPSVTAAKRVYSEFQTHCPAVKVGRIYGGRNEYKGDVTIMTYSALIRHFYKSLIAQDEKKPYPFNIRDYRVLIADEAHAYLSQLAENLLDNMDAVKIALTATDKYYEGKEVSRRFPGLINRISLDKAIKRKECANPITRVIQTNFHIDHDMFKKLEHADDDADAPIFSRAFNVPAWNNLIVDVWQNDVDKKRDHRILGDKTIIHCSDVDHATAMADRFNEALLTDIHKNLEYRKILTKKGIDPDKVEQVAAAMHGDMSQAEQERILDKFKKKQILVLTSAKLLTESIDDPEVRVVINATLTRSLVRALQRGYRGSRIAEGKDSWYMYEVLPAGWFRSGYLPLLFEGAALHDTKVLQEGQGRQRSIGQMITLDKKENEVGYKLIWDTASVDALLAFLTKKRNEIYGGKRDGIQNRSFKDILKIYLANDGSSLSEYLRLCATPSFGGVGSLGDVAAIAGIKRDTMNKILRTDAPPAEKTMEKFIDGLHLRTKKTLFGKSEADFWWMARGDKSIAPIDELMREASWALKQGEDPISVSSDLARKLFFRSGLLEKKAKILLGSHAIIKTLCWQKEIFDFNHTYLEKVDKLASLFVPEDPQTAKSLANLFLGFPIGTSIHTALDQARNGECSFGQLIRVARVLKRKNQKQMREELDLSKSTLGEWERDEVKPSANASLMESFARYLGYSTNRDIQDLWAIAKGTYCPPGMAIYADFKAGRITSRAEFIKRSRAEGLQYSPTEFTQASGIPTPSLTNWENQTYDDIILQSTKAAGLTEALGYNADDPRYQGVYTFIRFNKTLEDMKRQTADLIEEVKAGKMLSKAALVKRYRDVRRLTPEELGNEIGLSELPIREWEDEALCKFPRAGNAKKLAHAMWLDGSPDEKAIVFFLRTNKTWDSRKKFAQSQLPEMRAKAVDVKTIIDRFCEEYSLNRADLADEMGISKSRFVNRFIVYRDKPSRELTEKLANYLGFTGDEIKSFVDLIAVDTQDKRKKIGIVR